jgi:formate dehydrogenase
MPETKHTFCRICESLCGLEVDVENNTVLAIRPDSKHVATRGFGCPKGLKQHHIYNSPDRLKYPMKRIGKEWHRISWDQALTEIGQKVARLRGDFDPDTIAMYVGTAAGFGVLHPVFAQGFMTGVGSSSMFSSATQDCANKFAVAHHIYGFPFTQPFPDLLNTNCLVIVGANPVVSKWSFLQVPNPSAHIKEMAARGAKLYVVDPRRTETAKIVEGAGGKYIPIKPATDPWFYLSLLHEIDRQGGIREEQRKHLTGVDEVLAFAAQWPATRTEELTGISPEDIAEMAATFIAADGASVYSSTGVNMGGYGTESFWIQEVINAVTGNLDRKGGTLVGQGVIDFPKFGVKNGVLMRPDRSRIGDFASVNDTFPGGILADEILEPGDRQIRALFVTGGNPLLTMANSNRLREAFQKLELLVTLDIFPNETGSLAHYMLPCTSPLERPDLPFIFPLMLGLQVKPYLQATRTIVEPEHEQRDEASIYLDLCKAAGINLFGSAVAQRFFQGMKMFGDKPAEGVPKGLPQELLLSGLLRITGQGGFKSLLKHSHGKSRGGHVEGSFLGSRVTTEDGKVHLAPAVLLKRAERLEAAFLQELDRDKGDRPFRLISKRHVKTHNSWTHNYEGFVDGSFQSNYLYMHPEDMEAQSLQEKDLVDVSSATATVRLPVRALADLTRSTVALPHGWGHQSSHLSVAKETKGVNVNILVADGPEGIDKVSGMAHLTGIPVSVVKADGPQAKSWSGLEVDVLEV